MNDLFAAAKAESERRYPDRPDDDDFALTFSRTEIRAMLRSAFQAGSSWAITRNDDRDAHPHCPTAAASQLERGVDAPNQKTTRTGIGDA